MIAEYLLTELNPSTPITSYLKMDTLGSPRVIIDSSGNVQSRRDFMPFGEEISAIGGRTSGLGYQVDATRQKFTSYERDNETDLDFAQARMYSFKLGRFMVPDDPFMDQDENDPQSWNLFNYARNNPLRLVDPTGNSADDPGFWEKLGNWLNWGVWGGEEDVKKSEDLKRDWLIQNAFYQQAPDGTWYPIDASNMDRSAVWYFYNKFQLAIAEGRLTNLTPEQQAAANILPAITNAPNNAGNSTAANKINPSVGPSGNVSTAKFLEKNWDKATFGSVKKSIEYHLKKHVLNRGLNLTETQYTQQAIQAFKDSNAIKTITIDMQGRKAIQVVSQLGRGLYTSSGKIIWFHPN